jgi:hypothetical protein
MNFFNHSVTIWRIRVIILFWTIVIALQKGWQRMSDLYEAYEFDTGVQPFKQWLEHRLRRNQRDAVAVLARRLLTDFKIPRQASKSMYAARMRQYGYSADDIRTFLAAWQEYKTAELGGQLS